MKPDAGSAQLKNLDVRALLRNLLVAVSSVALMLLFLEGALRLFHAFGWFPGFYRKIGSQIPTFASKTGPGLYYAHPYDVYEMKPGYSSYDTVTSQRQTINSLGFRGPEITRAKPQGTYRIVAMGASTTYGIYLSDEDTYPLLLEQELRSRLKTDAIQVVNAGLTSATSAENMHRMFSVILPLQPDMIIYYEGYNDLIPRMFDGFTEDYYNFRKTPRDSDRLSSLHLYRLWMSATTDPNLSPNTGLVANISKLENLPADDKKKIRNFRSTTSDVYEQNLDNIIVLAKAKNIQVVLSTFAFNDDLYNWNQFMPDVLWGRGIKRNNQAVKELAALYDLPLIDWASYANSKPELFDDSIHMNPFGDAQQASLFADAIEPMVAQAMALAGHP